MNILFIKEETYLREIAAAIHSCPEKTLIIVGERTGYMREIEAAIFPIRMREQIDPSKDIRIEKEIKRKPWRERPKF